MQKKRQQRRQQKQELSGKFPRNRVCIFPQQVVALFPREAYNSNVPWRAFKTTNFRKN